MTPRTKPRTKSKTEIPKARTGDTPRADLLTPPSGKRDWVLPLVDVGSVDFERLCASLLRKSFPNLTRVALKRSQGQRQFGVDVEGFDELQNPTVVISCKCYHSIKAWELREWIRDFLDHLDTHWKDKVIGHFILAFTAMANDDDINGEARFLAMKLLDRGIKVRIWDTGELSELLRDEPALVDRYFNQYWTDSLSASLSAKTAVETGAGPLIASSVSGRGPLLAQIEALYAQPLNHALSGGLEAAIGDLRGGRRAPVCSWLEGAMSNEVAWNALDPIVRAKGMRAVAMVALAEGDHQKCRKLLDDAESIDLPTDRTARALLLRASDGLTKAQEYIGVPEGRRECELMAGLSIEGGDPVEALRILSSLSGAEVSAEVLRLRGIATFLAKDDRETALKLAKSAADKEPQSAAPLFTLGAMRIACALADATVAQFGSIPNPIMPSLVLSNGRARQLLDLAANDFDRLARTVQGELRREVEVWKLAALILNSDTRSNGRLFARSLLSRSEIDPAVVVWSLQHGLPIKTGKVRKYLLDELRRQKGTLAHLVALALIEARSRGSLRAAAVIERFAPDFPGNVDFIEYWRSRFSSVDAPVANFAGAFRRADEVGDVEPLIEFLRSDDAGPEEIISSAELLARRDNFEKLDKLREDLVSIGTARAIELAAIAALNNRDPQGALHVLDTAKANNVETSGRLTRVRLKARELLGDHPELIKELRRLLEDREDPQLRGDLLKAYLRIGDLDEVALQAEIVLDSETISQEKALEIAYVLKKYAPETARRALMIARNNPLPDNLTGPILALSTDLGLPELQEEMLTKLLGQPDNGNVLYRFESIDDAIAMVSGRADEYRGRLNEWLHGRLPAVAAMADDPRDYALLLLASTRARENRMGEPTPMILRAPLPLSTVASGDVAARPSLRVDLSALFIADRFSLIEPLERCFAIEIPRSLPEALTEMSEIFLEPSPQIMEAVRLIESGESAVEVIEALPTNAIELSMVGNQMAGDEKATFISAAEHAYRGGHLTKVQIEQIKRSLSIAAETPRTPHERLILSGGAAIDLIASGLLEPIARGFSTSIRSSELAGLLKRITIDEEIGRMKRQLITLRGGVARKLSSGQWKTIVAARPETDAKDFAKMPAHLRCTMEVLPRDEAAAETSFWIEDRTISSRALPNALNLPSVIAELVAKGELSPEVASGINRTLRREGYSFLPIDEVEIFGIIRNAYVEGALVVDNDELAELRRWYAGDVLYLRYVDPQFRTDKKGRMFGEGRRTLDLAALTISLLERTWCDEDSTAIQKVARSKWIWSNLRINYVPSPPAPDDPNKRRRAAAFSVAQVFCIPMLAEYKKPGCTNAWHRSFVAWLTGSIIGPMAKADVNAADDFVDLTAVLLSKILDMPEENADEIKAQPGTGLRTMVGELLSAVPEPWKSRIGGMSILKEALGGESIGVLKVADTRQVVITELENAIDIACRDPSLQSNISIYPGELRASVIVGRDEDGFTTARLEFDGQRVAFERSTIALAHPVAKERRSLLLSLPRESGPQSPMSEEFLLQIADDGDVNRRFERYQAALRADYSLGRELMWQRISGAGSINIEDFNLPSPGTLLNYLGLPADFRGDGAELLASAASVLRKELGCNEAFYRLSSLPLKLPLDFLRDFAETSGSELDDAWLADFSSPLHSFSRMFALAASGREIPETDAMSESISPTRTRYFANMVRHVSRQAIYDSSWRALPPELAVCLIWVHADQKVRDVSVEGIELGKLGGWLVSKSQALTTDRQHAQIWDKWVIDYSIKTSIEKIYANVVVELLDLGVQIPGSVKALLSQSNETWVPHPTVMAPPPRIPAGYWIGSDTVPSMVNAGWLPDDFTFTERDHSLLLDRILDELDGVDMLESATMIAMTIDLDEVDDVQIKRLRGKLDPVAEGFNLSTTNVAGQDAFLELFAKVCRREGDFDAFKRCIRVFGQKYGKTWRRVDVMLSRDNEGEGAALALLNASLAYGMSGNDGLSGRISFIVRALTTIVDVWPATLGAVLGCLDGLASQIDIPLAAENLLPMALALRTR